MVFHDGVLPCGGGGGGGGGGAVHVCVCGDRLRFADPLATFRSCWLGWLGGWFMGEIATWVVTAQLPLSGRGM